MSTSMLALVLYSAWTLLLLGAIGGLRTVLTLSGARGANRFAVDGSDVSPASHRLARAHANCYEHFPIVAGLLVAAEVSGLAEVTDGLALVAVGARVAQSVVHLTSTSVPAVVVRFGFLVVQLGIEAWWVVELLSQA